MLRQQRGFLRRVVQRHIDGVHHQQRGAAGVKTALEDLQIGQCAVVWQTQRLGGQPAQGLDGVGQGGAVGVGFARRVGSAQHIDRQGGQEEFEFGKADHGGRAGPWSSGRL